MPSPSAKRPTMDRTSVDWYDDPEMDTPGCPRCGKASPVALLSKVEKGRRSAQTWVCRECLSSFGDVEEWRRQTRKSELIRAGIGIAAAVGVSLLILKRKTRSSVRAKRQMTFPPHSPAFV